MECDICHVWAVLTRGERHGMWYLSCLSCTYNRRTSSNVISVMFWVVLTTGERHGMWYLSCLSCTYNRRTSSNVISVMFELYLQQENVIECDICHVWAILTTGERHRMWYLSCLSYTYNRRTSSNVISVMFELYLQEEKVIECDICHVLSYTYNRRTSSNVISAMFWAVLTRGERHRMRYLSCFYQRPSPAQCHGYQFQSARGRTQRIFCDLPT